MAPAGYLLSIDPRHFEKLNDTLAARCPTVGGEPLAPTSSSRAFLRLSVLKLLRSSMSGEELNKTLWKYGADWDSELDEKQAVALLQTRDANDLPPRTTLEQAPVRDPYSREFLDWHLIESNINGAWALFGDRNKIDWGEISVGHIDTGFTRHPALGFKGSADSVWIDLVQDRNFFSREIGNIGQIDSSNPFPVSDFDAEDRLGGFSGGHGTRTAGVLCGCDTTANAKTASTAGMAYAGFFGAAPKVPTVPIRLEDSIWIQNELGIGLPDSINYLVDSASVNVISLSMGSPRTPFTGLDVPLRLKASLRNAYDNGVIVVCAAGNNIPDPQVVFPARLPHTIAVGGSTPGSLPWLGSSYGNQVDISAPAYPIRRETTERPRKFLYGVGDGTSFATPQVAGTAALWLAHHKGAVEATYAAKWQRVAAFVSLLKSTARVPNGWPTGTRGEGILDARALLLAPLPSPGVLKREATDEA